MDTSFDKFIELLMNKKHNIGSKEMTTGQLLKKLNDTIDYLLESV